MSEMTSGLPGDYHDDANNIARKAWRALSRGTGMHLNADEVIALHQIQCDGEWWVSFGHEIAPLPAPPAKDTI